jgi:hypothetical protein
MPKLELIPVSEQIIDIKDNRPDLFVLDKRRNEISLIEVGITNQGLLQSVDLEKTRQYDLLSMVYKCKVKIIPYIVT